MSTLRAIALIVTIDMVDVNVHPTGYSVNRDH